MERQTFYQGGMISTVGIFRFAFPFHLCQSLAGPLTAK